MSAARGRSRSLLVGLLLCVAVVVGLVLVQGVLGGGGLGVGGLRGGGLGGGATAATPTASPDAAASPAATPLAPDPTGASPRATDEEPEAAHTPVSGLAAVAESALPTEAHDTLGLIRAGGPFPHRQDDETFFNREGILPDRPRGYYREYTVTTRGSPDRGARRIVAGQGGDLYYTTDHYDSFRQIEEER